MTPDELRDAIMGLPAVQSTDGYFGLQGSYYVNEWLIRRSDVLTLILTAANADDDPELDAYAASFNPARHADQGLRFNPDGSLIMEDQS